MKKAKFMLAAIAVIGIVGGVMASKARVPVNFFTLDGGVCTAPINTFLSTQPTDEDATGTLQNIYYSVPVQAACPQLRVYNND